MLEPLPIAVPSLWAQTGPAARRNSVSSVSQPRAASRDLAEFSSEARRLSRSQELPGELTDEEAQQVRELKKIDREVRAHEQAHKAVAGNLAAGISYEYEVGPDGQRYAVGGEVRIDTAPVEGDPEATLEKSERIKRAALAPSNPSAQDRQVAAQASAMAARAHQELALERQRETSGNAGLDLLA